MKSRFTKFRLSRQVSAALFLLAVAFSSCRHNSPTAAVAVPAAAPQTAAPVETPPAQEEEPAAQEEKEEPAPTTEEQKPEPTAETRAETPAEPVASPDAEGAVALVDDTATLLLRERLSPPKQSPVSPPVGSREPGGRAAGAVDLLTSPLFKLPSADVPKESGLLPSERLKTPFAHPALDLPPLAFARDPVRPDVPKLPLGPRAFVASPDSKKVPHIERFARDAEPAVLPADDPSAGVTRGVISASLALPVPVPAPPQLLSIPDPFENARAVELRSPPPDADPPVASHVRPTRPVLTPPLPPPPKP